MKLSNKGRYAIRAIFDIAFNNQGQATHIRDICKRQAIPPRFLEQIFQDLKRAGLVTSKRGPRGGYALSKPTDDILLGDIIRCIEGPITLSDTKETQRPLDKVSHLVMEETLMHLSGRVEQCFDETSIADMCKDAETKQLHQHPAHHYNYAI